MFFSFKQQTSYVSDICLLICKYYQTAKYGMIGLGRQFISPQQNSGPLFVKNMREAGAFKNGIFSVFLTLDPVPPTSPATATTISANNIQSAYVQSFIEFGKSSMMVLANQTKWF